MMGNVDKTSRINLYSIDRSEIVCRDVKNFCLGNTEKLFVDTFEFLDH